MSDQDFVIVDEEKDSEIPQEKENRTEDSRKEVVKDAEKEREDDDGYEKTSGVSNPRNHDLKSMPQ